ncbi:hypothetical protein X979_5956 [Burkholderia pseudomallei MSHR7527]|nr:hypothetical protein X979_5956 [Burkholderia pseudomallei MSHR7527]
MRWRAARHRNDAGTEPAICAARPARFRRVSSWAD